MGNNGAAQSQEMTACLRSRFMPRGAMKRYDRIAEDSGFVQCRKAL